MTVAKAGAASDIIKGGPAIGRYIGACSRTVQRRLAKGEMPGGYKIGQRFSCPSENITLALRRGSRSRRAAWREAPSICPSRLNKKSPAPLERRRPSHIKLHTRRI